MFSFQEMANDTIDEYFKLLRRCLKSNNLFYCFNRIEKKNKYDNTVSVMEEYPWAEGDEFIHRHHVNNYFNKVYMFGSDCLEYVVRLK
jgi:hypothetical protein